MLQDAVADLLEQKPVAVDGIQGLQQEDLSKSRFQWKVASKDKIEMLGLRPKMRLVDYVVVGVDPALMGIGPAIAVPKLLKRAGISKDDVGLWEINEAFAAQAIYCVKELGIRDHKMLNPRGSGIALGRCGKDNGETGLYDGRRM